MKQYYFYSKNDSSKEPIYTIKAISRKVATRKFAIGKQMSLENFLELYSVSQWS